MNGRKTETDNAENKIQKKQPHVLKRVRIQYIFVLLTFILLVGLGVFYIINLNQVATGTAIYSYQQTELEIVREAARGVEAYVYIQTEVLGRKDISAIEQEVYTKFIDPILLLKSGDAWIYAPDHIVFDQSADLPKEYWGKSMAEIFALQQKNGASHYEEMTGDVSNAREGVGYYVWLPEKGPEIAAWTPVSVGNNTWTIGLSTPLPEILEASGASSQIAMATAVILSSIILALILLSLWLYSDLKRKQVHEELRESEEKFRDIFDKANDAIEIFEIGDDGRPGRYIDVNEVACRMVQYSKDEMLKHSPLDFDIADYNIPPYDEITRKVRSVGHAKFDTGHRRKDGKIIPVEVNFHIITLLGQRVGLAIVRDISERKQVEERLKESRKQLAEAMDLAHLVNWEFDVASGIFTFNDRFYALYGTTAEREGGYQMSAEAYAREFVHPDEINVVADEMNKAIQAIDPNYVSELEHRIIHRNGEIRHIIVRFGITKDENGRTIKTHGANQDITDRKLAEEWLKKFSEELEAKVAERTEAVNKSLHEKDILFKEVHHRVKNNMQIIISLLNLQARTIDDPGVVKMIKESQSRIKAMALVHERLYRSGDISSIDLKDYIQFLARELFSFYGVKSQFIHLTINAPVINMNIDTAIPLGLMVNELISNAIKYAFPEDRRGEIVIDITKDKNNISLVVRDNGVGIPQDFDWRNAKSLGLRLVISLVEQLQGTIELDQMAGTAFTIVVKEKE